MKTTSQASSAPSNPTEAIFQAADIETGSSWHGTHGRTITIEKKIGDTFEIVSQNGLYPDIGSIEMLVTRQNLREALNSKRVQEARHYDNLSRVAKEALSLS